VEVVLVSLVVLLVIGLLVSEVIPVELTALGTIVLLMVTGLLAPELAVAGFANPAPITVGALFVVGRGISRTGALDLLTEQVVRLTNGSQWRLLFFVVFLAGAMSTVVNNTPVVVMFTAVVLAVCARFGLAPSKYLIPLSFTSILAGTSTLIGTSTNIIVSDMAAHLGHDAIGMFELSKLGIPLGLVGALFLFAFSFPLLPAHRTPFVERERERDKRLYLSELAVPVGSPLVGRDAVRGFCDRYPDLEVYEVLREQQVLRADEQPVRIEANDLVLAKGRADDLVHILRDGIVALPGGGGAEPPPPYRRHARIAEVVIPAGSEYVDRILGETHLGHEPDCKVIALKRGTTHYPGRKLREVHLQVGDILLVQGPLERLEPHRAAGDLIVVEDVVRFIKNKRKAPIAVAVFAAMIVVASTGLASILVASLAAAFLLLVTGCLTLREAYASLDVKVLLLIIGTLALGAALDGTGAAQLYADAFLSLFRGASPQVVLGAIIVFTSLLSHVLSNNATAVLLLPVALATAAGLGVDARPFIIAVCFGASASFASPIGYQTNLMVYGPGSYRFADFARVGLPLDAIVWVGATLFIPLLWPF